MKIPKMNNSFSYQLKALLARYQNYAGQLGTIKICLQAPRLFAIVDRFDVFDCEPKLKRFSAGEFDNFIFENLPGIKDFLRETLQNTVTFLVIVYPTSTNVFLCKNIDEKSFIDTTINSMISNICSRS